MIFPTISAGKHGRAKRALIAEPAVQRIDETALHRLDGGDVVPFDPATPTSLEDGVRSQLGAVAGDRQTEVASGFDDEIQFLGDKDVQDRVVYDRRKARLRQEAYTQKRS